MSSERIIYEKINECYYLVNRETGKLELHFDKADYDGLADDQKREIKSAFLWSRRSGCWISRCKAPNLWSAEKIAKALGLADGGTTGERLSFAEQQERKAEKAERRAERLENAASRAEARGEALQKPINDMRGDVAFFTQPNINSSAGRAFTRRRDRMFAAYEAGFKEFNKSAYYRERAAIAHNTAAQKGLQDKGFIGRRIAECETALRKLKKNVERYEGFKRQIEQGTTVQRFNGEPLTLDTVNEWIETTLDRMEAQLDKLGYYQDALDALGGVEFSQENIKPGYIVEVKHFGACRVVSTGPKNITYQAGVDGVVLTAAYAEISRIVSAKEKAAAPMKLWTEADVLAVMETAAFQAAAAKAAQRKQAAAKAVDTKRKNAEALADDLIASIHVQRIGMQALQELAVAARQKWYDFNGKDEIVDPSRETVNRWMVNYIRHNLCEYDDSLYMLFRPGSLADKEELYPKVKRETLAKIAQVYPELAEECKAQSNF